MLKNRNVDNKKMCNVDKLTHIEKKIMSPSVRVDITTIIKRHRDTKINSYHTM